MTATLNLAPIPGKERHVFVQVPTKRRSVVPGIVMFGVAAAAAGTGVGLFVYSQGQESIRQQHADAIRQRFHSCAPKASNYDGPADCDIVRTTADKALTFRNVAIGSFIGAGVAAIAGATYLIWPNPSVPPTQNRPKGIDVRATPMIGMREGGLLLSGSF